jgi:hypothetical protein
MKTLKIVKTYDNPNAAAGWKGTASTGYNTPINPYCKVDSSQVAWRIKCILENDLWFPYPQSLNLDASLYKQLYEKCGECYPTFIFGQCKGAFEDQLGNRFNSTNNEYQVYAS